MTKDHLKVDTTEAAPDRRGFIRKATLAGAAGAAVLLTRGTAQAADLNNGEEKREIGRHE